MRKALVRGVGLLVAVTSGTAVLGACGKPEKDATKQLRAAVAKTSRLPTQFDYIDVTNDGTKTEVQGVIEDDFRYRSRLFVNGKGVMDEVVHDDALAERFSQPDELAKFVRRNALPTAPVPGLPTKAETVQELKTGQWVVDPSGAPSVLGEVTEGRQQGDDPIYDARTIFQYLEHTARTMPVVKFNPDALEYKPQEDPFPKPGKGSGVVRYDFVRLPVPRPSQSAGGNQAVPGDVDFRKMAVYVKNGIIIRVLEDIDVASRLNDIKRNYGIKLSGSTRQQVDAAVAAINVVRKGQGTLDPIRVRRMEFALSRTGQKQAVRLPDGPLPGDLSFLIGRGRAKTGASLNPANNGEAAGQGTDSGTGAATPTTAAP